MGRTPVHYLRVHGRWLGPTLSGSVSREARVIALVSHTFIYRDIIYTLYAPDLYYKIIKRVNVVTSCYRFKFLGCVFVLCMISFMSLVS